ncbi:MAG: cell envelope biogenesis protein OmpA [Nitrospirota bacterium]|nr:cell envelope biogenesis protein OmpA [Nitrospirota bacterium]
MFQILLLVPIIFVFLAGCAGRGGPVLYPNAHLNAVGKEQAEIDIGECERLANEYIKTNPGGDTAGSTAAGGAAGAFVGGAAGAAGCLVSVLAKSSKPSQVYKNFVSRCLREKGYVPIGWQ